MAITKKELEKYASTLSVERLLSFKTDDNDTIDMLIQRYKTNLRISQALYPEKYAQNIQSNNGNDKLSSVRQFRHSERYIYISVYI